MRFSARRSLVILLVSIALLALLVWQLIVPLRQRVAERLVARGDNYLIGQQFTEAAAAYNQALGYEPGNRDAAQHLALTEEAPTDPAVAKAFYQQHDVKAVLDKLNQAQQPYAQPKQALQVGVDFYAATDYAYAQYPLERAVQLDPGYAEAWHYLALTYGQLAKSNPAYAAKAAQATAKQNGLTVKYLTPAQK